MIKVMKMTYSVTALALYTEKRWQLKRDWKTRIEGAEVT